MLRNNRDYSEQALDTLPLEDCVLLGPYDAILVDLREQLGWMQETLEILESGTTRIIRDEPPDTVNDTSDWIARQKARITRLAHVIAAYEKKNG